MSFLRPVNIVMILTGLKVDMEIIHSASSVEKTQVCQLCIQSARSIGAGTVWAVAHTDF